jgi:hypothetical protein
MKILQRHFGKGFYAILLIVSWLVLFSPIKGYAEEDALNFFVTPEFPESQVDGSERYFDLNLNPGTTERLSLRLQNGSDEAIKVQITPHTAYTNVHGVVEYGKDAPEPDTTLSNSLDTMIEPSEVIDLSGNETKTVTLTLHMPEESFDGFLAGGLRIQEVKEERDEEASSDEEGVAIKNEFSYVVGVVVSNSRDSVQPDLELLDVFANQLNARNVISATIQNFTPSFVNRLSIDATVQRAGEEEVLYESTQEMMQMAPNSHFDFPIPLNGDRFQSGTYILNLTARSGEDEWQWTQEFTIETDEARSFNRQDVTIDTSLNWWMVGATILLILLICLVTYMILKQRAISKKKEDNHVEKNEW